MRYEADMALIRHGMTPGNEEHRYIGRTDEPLSQKGREQLLTLQKKGVYPAAACVAASPLERCRQTAELLYPGQAPCVFDQFREMDFGAFEGHNYEELKADVRYQAWIDSGGTLPFPEGESREEFIRRSVAGYEKMVYHMKRIWERSAASGQRDRKIQNASAVVHGGTIMALLDAFAEGSYYDYQCANAKGYKGRLSVEFDAAGNTLRDTIKIADVRKLEE